MVQEDLPHRCYLKEMGIYNVLNHYFSMLSKYKFSISFRVFVFRDVNYKNHRNVYKIVWYNIKVELHVMADVLMISESSIFNILNEYFFM